MLKDINYVVICLLGYIGSKIRTSYVLQGIYNDPHRLIIQKHVSLYFPINKFHTSVRHKTKVEVALQRSGMDK